MQFYGVCHPRSSATLCRDLGDCMCSVASWMSANRLQLNAAKTEFMCCVPPRRRHQLPADQLTVGSVSVAPVDSVRDLGVLLNSDMSMNAHLTRLVSSCFGVLRQVRCIRRSFPREALFDVSYVVHHVQDRQLLRRPGWIAAA